MSDREKDADEGRLSRWSRLKTQARAEQDISALPEAPADGERGSQVPAPVEGESEENSVVVEDLPDIETLDKDSDFTPFLNVNVPDQLRRLALKKLWASDPAFASLDGLNDYDEDYSALGMIAEKVISVFQPGKGMPDPDPELEPGQDQSETADLQQPPEEVAEASVSDDDAEGLDEPSAASDGTETDDWDAPEEELAAGVQVPDDQDDPNEDDPGNTTA